jgi:integrase/recombinase XerC
MFIENFLSFLQHEKRYSDKTLVANRTDLIQFTDFLQLQYQVQNPAEANHFMVRSFIIQLIDEGVTPRSVNRKISALKSFYKFLKKRALIQINPMQKVIAPKTSKRLPVYVEQQPMQNLLQHDWFTDDFSGQRDRLIIELFYNTGIRREELINIQLHDVNLSQKLLKVLGKGNKERLIPFGEQLAALIRHYITYRNEMAADNTYLLLSDKGKKMYPKLVYNKVKHYLSLITTLDKKSPHVLRHTFATHLTNEGANLNAIKELLGHSSLAATQVYTHNNIQKLKDIYKKTHPKA